MEHYDLKETPDQTAGSVRLFSVRHEFPTEWARFKTVGPDDAKSAELGLTLRAEHYPFWSKGRLGSVKRLDFFARASGSVEMIYRRADGAENKTTLNNDPSFGELHVGEMTEEPLPAPTEKLVLLFDKTSVDDLWIAVTWGGKID